MSAIWPGFSIEGRPAPRHIFLVKNQPSSTHNARTEA